MEGLILVELVAIGCSHDVCVHILFRHEKFAIANQMVLWETGTIVETVLFVGSQTILIKVDTATRRAITPVSLELCLWALNGSTEICGEFAMLIVRWGVHQSLLAISSAESVQGYILLGNSPCVEAKNSSKQRPLTQLMRMFDTSHQFFPSWKPLLSPRCISVRWWSDFKILERNLDSLG